MRWGNIVLGILGLALLQGLVSGPGASNVGGVLKGAGSAVAWFVDPSVPAFKNSSAPAQPSTGGAAVASYPSSPISPSMNQPGPLPSTPGIPQVVV